MTISQKPSAIHKAFSPIVFILSGAIGETVNATISNNDKSYNVSFNLSMLVQVFDISEYVRSFFIDKTTQYISYAVSINGSQYSYTAFRSAANVLESHGYENLYNKPLTKFNTIKVYNGFPSDILILSNGDHFITVIDENGVPNFIQLNNGPNRFPLYCGLSDLVISKNRNYIVSFIDFICNKTDNEPTNYTVSLNVNDKELGDVEGGGTVAAGLSVNVKANIAVSSVFTSRFDCWLYNGIIPRYDIPISGEFFPEEDCTLVARFIETALIMILAGDSYISVRANPNDDWSGVVYAENIDIGDSKIFYARAASGYSILEWARQTTPELVVAGNVAQHAITALSLRNGADPNSNYYIVRSQQDAPPLTPNKPFDSSYIVSVGIGQGDIYMLRIDFPYPITSVLSISGFYADPSNEKEIEQWSTQLPIGATYYEYGQRREPVPGNGLAMFIGNIYPPYDANYQYI